MPYTVAFSFDKFLEAINLPGDHRGVANARRDYILKLLENKLHVVESFASGSIPRFTALRAKSDLDLIVALHYGSHIRGRRPSQVLQTMRDALADYATSLRRNGQAVTLSFKSWPNVDIVPAAQVVDNAGNITSYEIPDMTTEKWLTSRPKAHTQNIAARASTCGETFRQIIKMVKHWNRRQSNPLESFHIEAMATQIFTSPLVDLPWDVFTFFRDARTLTSTYFWYEGGFADDYLTYDRRPAAADCLKKAEDIARTAWAATFGGKDDHRTAINNWRSLFGQEFPAYG